MRAISMKTQAVVRAERAKGSSVVLSPWWT